MRPPHSTKAGGYDVVEAAKAILGCHQLAEMQAVIRSSILCIRGTRSSSNDADITLATSEGLIPQV